MTHPFNQPYEKEEARRMTMMKIEDMKVLAVDDNEAAKALLCEMLNDLGIEQVTTAEDGQAALEYLQACDEDPDVVLCDWNMPRMSGMDLAKTLQSVDPSLPFVMITGASAEDHQGEAKANGVTSFLVKPFTKEDLAKKLKIIARVAGLRASAA
jgi:two-component system chemotaxis response regulator CheY